MAKTLYWHDYETFGADPSRDCPSQFAGVRTDEDLNVIGEPLSLYCQPPVDRLPSPVACLVTGITPQKAREKGVPEPEFIAGVYRELALPGTCGVGYNSIRFDDEVTRYALYRNFYDPYEREWKHGNSRWDIIDMVRLARALRPEGIEWPNYDDGSPCFKLEELTRANGITHQAAHDALSDVLATIAMARLVKEKQPKLYRYVYEHRTKSRVAGLIDLQGQTPFLHVSGKLPRENGYTALMMPLARHPTNQNAIICCNLMGNTSELMDLPAETIRERLFTRTDDLPEGIERPPLKNIQINRCPVVGTPKLLDAEAAKRLRIDVRACERNWQALRGRDLSAKLSEVFAAPSFERAEEADRQLYAGFLNDIDRALLPEVRSASPAELAADQFHFSDERYERLLFLYRARHYPDTLTEEELHQWEEWRFQRLTNPSSGYLSLDAYHEEIDQLLARPETGERERSLLQALREWGDQIL